MSKITKALKYGGRCTWELFKATIPAIFMYLCAGTIMFMLTMNGETVKWNTKNMAWSIVCIIAAVAYNGLAAWATGASHYEMLVSGNMKRISEEKIEGGYKISSHKLAKEYRVWKGFAMGLLTSLLFLVMGILFGCMQDKIDVQQASSKLGWLRFFGLLFSGWTLLPFYGMNANGASISYFFSLLIAMIPILVSGAFYIIGAYVRRSKRLYQNRLAQEARQRETANSVKKINYGALPGTKPKKRK